MSVNREKPYLIVLFEDDAYKDLFMGFEFSMQKQISQRPVCGGFDSVHLLLTNEKSILLKELNKFPKAYVLALIDADSDNYPHSQKGKIDTLKTAIDVKYQDRVFIIGSKIEAEDIKQVIIGQGKWKTVSQKLEDSCKNDHCQLWQDDMLKHNLDEISRLKQVFNWE